MSCELGGAVFSAVRMRVRACVRGFVPSHGGLLSPSWTNWIRSWLSLHGSPYTFSRDFLAEFFTAPYGVYNGLHAQSVAQQQTLADFSSPNTRVPQLLCHVCTDLRCFFFLTLTLGVLPGAPLYPFIFPFSQVVKFTEGKEVKKFIYVPGRIISFVVK